MNKRLVRVITMLSITMLVGASLSACTASKTQTTTETSSTSTKPALGGGGKGGPGGAAVDTSTIKQKWIDVAYADKSAAQKLDVYLPNDGTGPFPVIIAIHGGAFKSGDKSGELGYLQEALTRGYAVVSVNYRLSGEGIFPAQINDVKAAIRFVKANASKY